MAKNLNAKFFRDGEKNKVEVSVVSSKDTIIQTVTPQHIADFPKEWEAYTNGAEMVDHGGTPLTEVPGISSSVAMNYKLHGVHNAEMLAEIPDIACRNLGMGAMAARNAAKNLIDAKTASASAKENEELKARIAALEKGNQQRQQQPGKAA